MEKTKVFNVIILDKSGSMSSISQAAVDGVNQTIKTIRSSQAEFEQTQEHYLLLNAFCSHGIDTIYNNVSIEKAKEMTIEDYKPCCSTPLYDAIGITLTKLEERLQKVPDYLASVTIITDGYENDSRRFSGKDISDLISRLKEMGWRFTYLGANHDVEKVAKKMSIDNYITFEHTKEGTQKIFACRNVDYQIEGMALDEIRREEFSSGRRFSGKERSEYLNKRLQEERKKREQQEDNLLQQETKDNSMQENQQQEEPKKKGFFKRLFSNK